MLPYSLFTLFLCALFTLVFSTHCPEGTGAVFLVDGDRPSLDNIDHCFENCATTDCTGVLINPTSCVTLNVANYFGELDYLNFVKKRCVKGVINMTVALTYMERRLDVTSQKIVKAADQQNCLRQCVNEREFLCYSLMFYEETQECLLNNASTDTNKMITDTTGYKVTYMERKLTEEMNDCRNSFQQISWDSEMVRGDTKLFNGSEGLDKCTSFCDGCDFVIFNEIYSECFIVTHDPNGQRLDFVNEEYQVLENICHPPVVECTPKNSIYVSLQGESTKVQKKCLEKCLANSSCRYVVYKDGKCQITDHSVRIPTVIERHCTGSAESEFGILFDESEKCLEGEGMVFEDIDMHQCMQLCVTHPTKSCESISFLPSSRKCTLLGETANLKPSSSKCHHFSLNIIQFEESSISEKSISKKKPMKKNSKAQSADKRVIKKIEEGKLKPQKTENLIVETKCNYDAIVVEISASSPIFGQLFLRNSIDNCSITVEGSSKGSLRLPLNSSSCVLEQSSPTLYSAVVVYKESHTGSLPVITEQDRMYRISCDYQGSSNITNVVAASALSLKDASFKSLALNGKVPMESMKMELRSKREQLTKSVSLGQPIDLVFKSDGNMKERYQVRRCTASNQDNTENMTLIEHGCPTASARSYILRGDVIKRKAGFTIPFRAFRFKQGDGVKISCKIEMCKKCVKPICSETAGRQRRYLAMGNETPESESEEVVVTMKVEEAVELKKDLFCLPPPLLFSLVIIGSLLFTVQLFVIFRGVYSRSKTSQDMKQ